jgi:hypothetical protein
MLSARAFFVEAQKNQTIAIEAQEQSTPEAPVAGPKFTKEELEVVEGLMKDNEKWMDPLMEVQVRLDKAGDNTEDPVIFTKDLNERGKLLQTTVCPFLVLLDELTSRFYDLSIRRLLEHLRLLNHRHLPPPLQRVRLLLVPNRRLKKRRKLPQFPFMKNYR